MKSRNGIGWGRFVVAPAVVAWGIASPLFAQSAVPLRVMTEKAFPTGSRATSVLLMERETPADVRTGESFSYSVRITNITQTILADVTLSEQYPEGMAVQEVSPPPTQQQAGRAAWTFAILNPGQSASIQVAGTAGRIGTLTGCATITFSASICSESRVVEPRLTLTKSAPPEVLMCDEIPYRVVVTNAGTGVARRVRIDDALPAGLVSTEGRNNVSFDAGDLAAGQSREFTFRARATSTGNYRNTARASEPGGPAVEASADTVVRVPRLELSQRGPELRFIHRPAEYEISVRNSGDAPAADTIVTATIPMPANFVRADEGGQTSGGVVTWRLGTLAVGAQRALHMVVQPTERAMLKSTATAKAVCADATAGVSTEVRGVPAILLEVVDLNDPVEIGQDETYQIAIVNQGSADGTHIAVVCDLPEGMTFVSGKGPTASHQEGQRVTFDPLPLLAPKTRTVYTVVTRGSTAGDMRFKVTLKSDQTDSPVEETESTHVY